MTNSSFSLRFKSRSSLLLAIAFLFLFLPGNVFAGQISADVLRLVQSSERDVPVLVLFKRRVEMAAFKNGRGSAPRLIRSLRSEAEESQRTALSLIAREAPGRPVRSFWINNSLALAASRDLIEQLATLPEVVLIEYDAPDVSLGADDVPPDFRSVASTAAPSWSVARIFVDSVWEQYSLDGAGVLIGSMDTGIDTSHPALRGRWRGGENSWKDFIAAKSKPYDDLGHGVSTMGIVVGGDGPGTFADDIGIAYNARFISAKMLRSGYSSNSEVIGAAEWMLDPDGDPATNDFPAVINNSWFSGTRGSTWFVDAADAWRAAGIIPVFIAGNQGPDPSSTRSPGDYKTCLSVGGTNSTDGAYGATSVGPSAAGSAFPADRRKPDVSAPGARVPTSALGGGYAPASGTSFAAPFVTGMIALMLQAYPALTYDDVLTILKSASADIGTKGYDYTFGYGRIDALAAVRYALGKRIVRTPDTTLVLHAPLDSAQFTLVLTGPPSSIVYVGIASSDTLCGIPAPASIIFTPDDWNVPRDITIHTGNRPATAANIQFAVRCSFSSPDPLFNAILVPEIRVAWKRAQTTSAEDPGDVPPSITLMQNYPNPFNPTTDLRFTIADLRFVSLKVYNILGEEVAELAGKEMPPGSYTIPWDASAMPSGVYYYRLTAGAFTDVKRMLLVK